MRALHPTTTFPRNDHDYWGPFILDLCEAIQDKDVEVEVVASNPPGVEEINSDVKITRFDYFFGKRFQTLVSPPGILPNLKSAPWRSVQLPLYYRYLSSRIRKRSGDADLVHAHWLIPTGFAAVRNSEVPVLASALGAEYHVSPGGILGKMVKYVHKKSDVIVTMSEYMKERGIEKFGCDPEKIEIIPNSANTEVFRPGIDTDIRKELDIPEDSPLVTTIRRLVPEKRVEEFVRAAPIIKREIEDVRFLIVGDGPERERIENLVKSLGMEQDFFFSGYLPHEKLPEVLSTSDISVMTTEQEGMSTSLLESMSSGTPVIATDAVSNGEVIDDGENGHLYTKGEPEMLAEKVLEVLSNPDKLGRMSKRAREEIVENFSYDRAADEYVKLYREIIN